ncbi:hypothetical protein J3A84_02830 [Proteiniclasticum sp. SCR006]|uniref:Nucleotidyltransferase domain-containing protein n=1 Tax=Proteiniclasticum aestuarii TaxID=2817862 RepID=A0A939H9Q5_9CLOT|nr:hypothetical protein [Proteiniclasticum aestuarii]MBO1263977.1 hypothetical protein [Proteiniclasticum aestuarii]
MNLEKIAELFIGKIRKDYADDVALVVVMGSYIYGATHDRSDLDLYFVPKTQKGYQLGFTFILEEIGFDLWPISWQRLESIARHEERITSIVTEGKVIYHAAQEDLDRFLKLKSIALDVSSKSDFAKKANNVFQESYRLIYRIQEAETLSELRQYGIRFVNHLGYALSLLNCNTVKRGRGKLKKELLDNVLIPDDFEACYDTLFLSDDMDTMKKDLSCLLKNTEKLIHAELDRYQEKGSAKNVLSGFYEELISSYNKIYHAAEVNDPNTALFAACELQHEIMDVFQYMDLEKPDFPDLAKAYDPDDLHALVISAEKHKRAFEDFLKAQHVPVRKFTDLSEYENHLSSL